MRNTLKIFILIIAFFLIIPEADAAACFPNYVCGDWSDCEDGLQSRTCTDTKCGRRDIVERGFCEKPGCRPKIECGDWGTCFYTEKSDDLIEGKVSFGGYRTRTCEDANGCVESFIQEGTCEESYNLKIDKIQECNEDFLAISDPTSQRQIAKINLQSWELNKLDIVFVQGKTEYCTDCYNAAQDNDELGIDCGGDCKPCKEERKLPLFAVTILLWFLSALFSFLTVIEIVSIKKNVQGGPE